MNPFVDDNSVFPYRITPNFFFGKQNKFDGFISKRSRNRPSYGRMFEKRIAKRRKRNKIAYKSRRLNRIRAKKLHHKVV